jgi:hypothetical protein
MVSIVMLSAIYTEYRNQAHNAEPIYTVINAERSYSV